MPNIAPGERLILQNTAYGGNRLVNGHIDGGEGWVQDDEFPSGMSFEIYVLNSTRSDDYAFITRGTDGDTFDFDVKLIGLFLHSVPINVDVDPDSSGANLGSAIGLDGPDQP